MERPLPLPRFFYDLHHVVIPPSSLSPALHQSDWIPNALDARQVIIEEIINGMEKSLKYP
jgi:hypothetical protein